MSLSEETLSLNEQLPFTSSDAAISVKSKIQQELDNEKEKFFKSGGKITVYDNFAKPTNAVVEQKCGKDRKVQFNYSILSFEERLKKSRE